MSDIFVSSGLPADVEADLNALFDESDGATAGPADAEGGTAADPNAADDAADADQRAQVPDDADEVPPAGAGKGQKADATFDAPDEDAPVADQETDDADGDAGAGQPPAEASAEPTVEELRAEAVRLKAELDARNAFVASLKEAAAEAEGKRQYQEFMASLEDMDPEDAAAKKAEILLARINQLEGEKRQQEYGRRYQEEKAKTIDILAAGWRRDQQTGQWVQSAKPLPEDVKADLALFDGETAPWAMQQYADTALKRRAQQTAAARSELAAQRAAAGEGKVGGGGDVRGGTAPLPEPTTEEELWALQDSAFGGTPMELRDAYFGLPRHRAP